MIARWKITWGVLFDPISAYPHSPWAGAQLDPALNSKTHFDASGRAP